MRPAWRRAAHGTPDRRAWVARLPEAVVGLAARWELAIGEPFDGHEVSAAWVAPVTRATGAFAVLKLGMPHMEARDEIAGLRFWDAGPSRRCCAASGAPCPNRTASARSQS